MQVEIILKPGSTFATLKELAKTFVQALRIDFNHESLNLDI